MGTSSSRPPAAEDAESAFPAGVLPELRACASWWTRLLLCLVPGGLFLAAFMLRSRGSSDGRFTLFDDAMVSMAYARTLAQTGEWAWFPGAERTQGFTNPLWTLWMAFVHTAGLDGSSAALAISISGLLLVVGCALAVAITIRRSLAPSTMNDWAAAIAAGTVLCVYPLAFWSLRGMEVGLLALLTMLMVLGLLRLCQRWASSQSGSAPLAALVAVGILGILTRLDFAIIAATVGLLALLWAPDSRRRRSIILGLVLPLVAVAGLLLAFQQAYFGDVLTNTFRLKMEGFSVGDRLQRGIIAAAKELPVLILVVLSLAATARARPAEGTRRAVIALSSAYAVTVAYSIWVGGDAWEWAKMSNRFVSVGLPAAIAAMFIGLSCLLATAAPPRKALLAALGVFSVSGIGFGLLTNPIGVSESGGAFALTVLAIASAAVFVGLMRYWRLPSHSRGLTALLAGGLAVACATSAAGGALWIQDGGIHVQDDAQLASLSLELRDVTSPDAVIATVWAGAPGYYSARPMIDLLGRSDRIIATSPPAIAPPGSTVSTFFPGHNKWSYDISVGQRRPDVVLQTWFPTDDDLRSLAGWGYVRRCWSDGTTESYFRAGSPYVRWDRLRDCSDSPAS